MKRNIQLPLLQKMTVLKIKRQKIVAFLNKTVFIDNVQYLTIPNKLAMTADLCRNRKVFQEMLLLRMVSIGVLNMDFPVMTLSI